MDGKNFAIIGVAGYIAPRHIKAIQDLGGALQVAYDVSDSVGILDSVSPQAEFFTEFERFYDYAYSIKSVPSRALDYIVVCSPNYLHRAHISAGLRLGCDVICEKPLVPNVKDLEYLKLVEAETGRKVFNILQLRHHEAIVEMKTKIANRKNDNKYEVSLTYITSRGKWYMESWKGNHNKSFGIETNIGIHFFDMLSFLFGDLVQCETYYSDHQRSSGYLEYENAKVKWFLSISQEDVKLVTSQVQPTYRSITVDGEEIEFSKGFTELHTVSYQNISKGDGFGIEEARNCIETVAKLRDSKNDIIGHSERLHFAVKRFMKDIR